MRNRGKNKGDYELCEPSSQADLDQHGVDAIGIRNADGDASPLADENAGHDGGRGEMRAESSCTKADIVEIESKKARRESLLTCGVLVSERTYHMQSQLDDLREFIHT